jgi:hypothetical protein
VKDLDLAMIGREHAVVINVTKQDKAKLHIFKLDFQNNQITAVAHVNTGAVEQKHVAIATAYENVIVHTVNQTDLAIRAHIYSGIFDSISYQPKSGEMLEGVVILDIATVKKIDFSQPDYASTYYMVAAAVRHNHLVVFSWEIHPDGTLTYMGEIDAGREAAEELLLPSEADWEHGSIAASYWMSHPGFVIVGKGVGREVRNESGSWEKTAKGLKILYGYILDDGRPTLESSNLVGSGHSDAMRMLDVSGGLSLGDEGPGVVSAHKTKDDYVQLIFWKFEDHYRATRWAD